MNRLILNLEFERIADPTLGQIREVLNQESGAYNASSLLCGCDGGKTVGMMFFPWHGNTAYVNILGAKEHLSLDNKEAGLV